MRRREFVKTSSMALTAMALPGASFAAVHTAASQAGETGQEEPLQLALIGVGTQGRALLDALRQVPNVRVRALCDIWERARDVGQKYLARYGQQVSVYADYREMLDKEPSLHAVLIATPDFVHAEQTLACLEHGLHVYCEPMLAHTLADTRRVVEAASRSDRVLQVGFQRRSNPRYQHVYKALFQEARLTGPIGAVQTQWAQAADGPRGWPQRFAIAPATLHQHGYDDMHAFRNWMWDPKYCLGPFGSHVTPQLDVCNWFLDSTPQAVLASGAADYYPQRKALDTVMAVFEFPGPSEEPKRPPLRVSCHLLTTTSGGGSRQYERFLGTEGSIQISENPRWTRIGREPNADDWDQWVRCEYLVKPQSATDSPADPNATNVHVSGELELFQLPSLQSETNCMPHIANFCAAVRGQAEPACPAAAAWPSHLAAFKTLEAIAARQTIDVGE